MVEFEPSEVRNINIDDQKVIFETLLEDDRFYDIASALRGNDMQDMYLKWIFTARIRGIVVPDIRSVSVRKTKTVIDNFSFNSCTFIKHSIQQFLDQVNLDVSKKEAVGHYLNHVTSALSALKSLDMADDNDELYALLKLVDSMKDYIEFGYKGKQKDVVLAEINTIIDNLAKVEEEK